MATETTHIRIGKATKARLDAEIGRLMRAYEQGRTDSVEPGESNNPAYKGLSHDALINRLLDLDARKRERAAAARRRKQQQTQ